MIDGDIYKRLLESQFRQLASGLSVPGNFFDLQTSTSAIADPPPLTYKKLRETMAALRPLPPPARLVENEYMTVDKVRWEGGGHVWRKASLSPGRTGAMLALFIMATSLQAFTPLVLAGVLLALRPRGWWEPVPRRRIVEQVPAPYLLKFEAPIPTPFGRERKETLFVGHPMMIAQAKWEIEQRYV